MPSPRSKQRIDVLDAGVHEVPSSFVGRAAALAALRARFDEGARLVTVVAPGGMGKTRIATRFASLHGPAYAAHGGGVWMCDLTDAADITAMCGVIAQAVGAPLERSKDERAVVQALGRAIVRRKQMLLVLDNLEHLAREAAAVMRTWLGLAPEARFLVTSRVAIGIPGEHLVPLEPLPVPMPGLDRGALLATEGVDLFLRRVREIRPGFEPSDADLEALAAVVRATDGIPLAVELAAARMRVLTLADMRTRLAAPLDLLARRDDTGRHASMRRTILDSLAQLDEPARAALAATSVFRGGFTLEAAEQVIAAPGTSVLSILDVLVARSLLRAREADGEIRFSSFETIRELAAEELAARPDLADRTAARHARYFARLARDHAEDGGAAGSRLARDLDNLVVAHARAALEADRDPTGDGPALALSLACAIAPAASARGRFQLCLSVLDRALAAARSQLPGTSAAIVARGVAKRELGETDAALADLEAGRALARAEGDAALEALACVRLGEIIETLGRTGEARAIFAEGLDHLGRAPDGRTRRVREAEIRANLGHALRREGDLESAERETKRALALFRETGIESDLPRVLCEAGVIALFRRDYATSNGSFGEALTLARRLGARQAEGAVLSARGILLQETGDLAAARAHHAQAVRVFHEIGSRHREGSALYYLGSAFLEEGSTDEAAKLLARAFDIMRGVMPRYEVLIAGCLAALWSDAGAPDVAADWLDRARAAARACATEPSLQTTLALHESHVSLVRATESERTAIIAKARSLAEPWSNDDVRFALRLLLARTRPEALAPAGALVVRDEGASFRLPDARSAVDLTRRVPLRRILHALARLRVDAPGEPLSTDELVRAGWPGERMSADAASNRVRVALATLRKLGLRDAIVTGTGGYLLDPALSVVLDDANRAADRSPE
ncbi:MAG: tetratricopeptide repeat protein [Minicystis sp.]